MKHLETMRQIARTQRRRAEAAEARVAGLEDALERRIVAFSGDRILCLECHAVTTGSIQDMALRHAEGCPIAGRVTHHPSR